MKKTLIKTGKVTGGLISIAWSALVVYVTIKEMEAKAVNLKKTVFE